ncbi:MAG TPA: YncE family protein [Rhizomicrobium sp.]|jgi:YVTN family beta-propeller protein
MAKPISLAFVIVAMLATSSASYAASSGYHILKTITLGGEGGWDYLNQDAATSDLYITRGSHVMVVDPAKGAMLADISGLQGVHGTVFVKNRAYVTEGGANRLAVIDKKSFKKIGEIAVGERPDGVLYDDASGRIFTFNGKSNDATAVDPATGKAVGTVPLGGKPEAASSDGAGMIFVNIEDKNELVAFDTKTLAVKAHYPLTACEGPSGQAIDKAHGRIFSVCDGNVMAVTDARTAKVVASVKIGDGPDASRFDAVTGLVFSPNGESGNLTVIHQDTPDKYTVTDTIKTASGARTMELDEKSHLLYLVTADRKPGVPTAAQPHPRAVPVSGTFRLIILGR